MDEHIDNKLKQHLTPIHERLDEISELIQSGFPNGDADEHRKIHERQEAQRRLAEKRWEIVKTKLLENSMWALMVAFVLGAWYWIKGNIK
jgi:Na+/phosphate symporter